MSATIRAVALAGGLGLTLGAGGVWLARGSRERAPAVAAMQESAPAAPKDDRPAVAPVLAAAALRAAIRDEVRSAIHDEAEAAAKPTEDPAVPPAAKPPAAPTPSYEKAKAHVVDRLAQGSWSEADRDRIQAMLGDMTEAERTEVIRQVIVAANNGQLRVQMAGPLF